MCGKKSVGKEKKKINASVCKPKLAAAETSTNAGNWAHQTPERVLMWLYQDVLLRLYVENQGAGVSCPE